MHRPYAPSIFFAFIFGFIGVALMSTNVYVGGGLFCAALIVGLIAFKAGQSPQPQSQHNQRAPINERELPVEAPIQTISSQFEIGDIGDILKELEAELKEPKLPVPIVGHDLVQQLLAPLRSKGMDVKAPVYFAGDRPVTVRDVVKVIASIVESSPSANDVQQLVKDMPAIYEVMWDNAEEAMKQHQDEAGITQYVAQKSMTDSAWKELGNLK